MSSTIETFDASRAKILDKPKFKPFYPRQYLPLSIALERGDVDAEQRLVLAEVGSQALALDLKQMAYHHVAQGELAGEPWLVTF